MRIAREVGLKEPEFIQDDAFTTVIYRPAAVSGQVSGQVTGQVTEQINELIRRIILVLENEMKRSEIMEALELSHRENFIKNYLEPVMHRGYIEQTYPENPKHRKQKYRLTKKGLEIKRKLL